MAIKLHDSFAVHPVEWSGRNPRWLGGSMSRDAHELTEARAREEEIVEAP